MTLLMMSPEFELAAAAIRLSFKHGRPKSDALPVDGIDWSKFLALAKRHRIQALVWDALGKQPSDIPGIAAHSLSSQAASIVGHNLRTAAESASLLAAFRQREIPLLFVKGVTLGALAYRNPFLKMGWDIDLLVPSNQIAEAASVLRDANYQALVPANRPTDEVLASWHVRRKESLWRKDGGQFHIDLHSRLADNPSLIPFVDVTSSPQQVEVAKGIVLPTLGSDELYSYLCVHGASSAWFRLKWVADFAALIGGCGPSEIARLHNAAIKAGAARASAQALLLSHRYFATDLGGELRNSTSIGNRKSLAGSRRPAAPYRMAGPAGADRNTTWHRPNS